MNDIDVEFGKDSVSVRLIRHILDMSYESQMSLLKQLEGMPTAALDISDREDRRRSFTSNVAFTVQGVDYTGTSSDISAGGMFIKTDASFPVGQTMSLTIQYTNRKRQARVPAEIVNVREDGIGVRFLKKDDA